VYVCHIHFRCLFIVWNDIEECVAWFLDGIILIFTKKGRSRILPYMIYNIDEKQAY